MANNNLSELARKKLLKNLLDKLNSGKTLTANERRQFDELSEEFSDKKEEPRSDSIEVTNQQLARLLKVTPKTICEWVKVGMPKSAFAKYDLFACIEWWHENINEPEEEKDTGITEAKRRHWNAKADESEIKVAQIRGGLISKSDVEREWIMRCSELRTGLLSWASRLPPRLEGLGQIEMRLALREEARNLLNTYSRSGRFTPDGKEPSARKPRKKNARRR